MANEISLTVALNCTDGNLVIDKKPPTILITQATQYYSAGVQLIGTTYEHLVIGSDVATAGVSYFRNLDPTNYVELGREVAATFYPFAKIKPGEAYPVRLATNSIYANANVAAVKLENLILAD